jgi:hypothetical protein
VQVRLALSLSLALSGCVRREIPDPRGAVQQYRQAIAARDPAMLRAMMTDESRLAYSAQDVALLLREDGAELQARAAQLSSSDARVESEATLELADGATARLTMEDGAFRVAGAGAFPLRPGSPEETLREFARALRERNLTVLAQLLTEDASRRLLERVDALATALIDLPSANVELSAERARVELADGQTILLRREQGIWLVEELP